MNPSSHSSRNRSSVPEDDSTLHSDIFSHADHSAQTNMASDVDRRLHDVGVAALAAVSQYPRPVNDHSGSFLVSEVVNAVTGAGSPPDFHVFRGNSLLPGHRSFYPTPSDTDSASGPDFVFGSRPDRDVNMDSVVRQLLDRAAGHDNMTMITQECDDSARDKDMVMDYESDVVEDNPSPPSIPDDEFEDFIRFYPDEEEYYHQRRGRPTEAPPMADFDLNDFYLNINYDDIDVDLPQTLGIPVLDPSDTPDFADQPEFPGPHPASIIHTSTYERNLTIDEFIQRWMVQTNVIPHGFHSESRIPPQLRPLSKMISWSPPQTVVRPHEWRRDFYDLQQIPWTETLRVKRSDARTLRDAWYTSYHNLDYSHMSHAKRLPGKESFFRGTSMHTSYKASIEHFQLRNLISTPASNTVHFACHSKVLSWTPTTGDARCLIDLSQADPDSGFLGPVKISTMKTAHGLTIAGGFCGEYALRSSTGSGSGTKGLVTPDFNDGITNHVDIIPNRTGPSPIGVFASNDKHLRILDTETNIFTSDHELSQPINCTATSPDSRLRVVIGDSPDAWVIESDTGRPVHPLRGHRDFGFACAWSPDMRHIATSNQDKTLIIWDARTWRPLETIDSDVAGYRSLRFSPVGGGPRMLLCTEPADRISILDAQLFQSRQVHDFFGEIGGADFSPDGSEIWVANTDRHFGGFMQYERRQWGQRVGLTDLPSEWASEVELEEDSRCVLSARERSLRFLRNLSSDEHEALIL
jgi:WD40 repeat protein